MMNTWRNRHRLLTNRPFMLLGWTAAVSILFAFAIAWNSEAASANDRWPVKGMVTMIDLGAKKCIPCKMMAPIMEKMEKKFAGKAAIVFIDVWEDREPVERFGLKAIPTQIFFDAQSNEVYRHVGFMSEEAITSQLKSMGVE